VFRIADPFTFLPPRAILYRSLQVLGRCSFKYLQRFYTSKVVRGILDADLWILSVLMAGFVLFVLYLWWVALSGHVLKVGFMERDVLKDGCHF